MADRLKIAMLGHKHMLSREGGVEIVVNELATRMTGRGNQVICYDRKGSHVSGEQLDTRIYNNERARTYRNRDKNDIHRYFRVQPSEGE